MLRPVSRDSCSLMCRVGFGVAANAAFRVSSCLALMVVRGPRRFPTALCSSFSLPHTSLSDKCPVSESLPSSCGSWESGERLGSLHVVTAKKKNKKKTRTSAHYAHSFRGSGNLNHAWRIFYLYFFFLSAFMSEINYQFYKYYFEDTGPM